MLFYECVTKQGAAFYISLDGSLGLISRGTELKLGEAVMVSANSEEKVKITQR